MLPSPDILNEFEFGKFVLSNLAAKRAKQIQEGAVPLVHIESKHPLSIALAEIAAGKVKATLPDISNLPPSDHELSLDEDGRPAEFNVLLPSLDEIDPLGLEDDIELDVDLDSDGEPSSISDLVTDDDSEIVEADSDEISLSDLKDQESFEEGDSDE